MANEIKLKRSATPAKVPLTTDLVLGELAVNTYDGKLYMKKDDGTEAVVEVGGSGGSGGNTTFTFTGATSSQSLGTSITAPLAIAATQTITLPSSGGIKLTYMNLAFGDIDISNSIPQIAIQINGTWYNMRNASSGVQNILSPFLLVGVGTVEYAQGALTSASEQVASIDLMVAIDTIPTGSQSVTFGFYSDDGEAMTLRGDLTTPKLVVEIIDAT